MNKIITFLLGSSGALLVQLSLNEVPRWISVAVLSILVGGLYMASEPFEDKK